MSPTNAPPIDITAFNALRAMVGEDTLPAIIDQFIEHAATVHTAIEESIAHNDAETLAATAHKLKPSSKQFGLMKLHHYLMAFEAFGNEGDMESAKTELEALTDALIESRNILRDLSS